LKEREAKLLAPLVDTLARADAAGTMGFILSILGTEPSGTVRLRIVDRLGRHSDSRVQNALECATVSDPDLMVSLTGLKRLRIQRNEESRDLVKRRMRLRRFHQTSPSDFAVALEDNFYSRGMESPD